MALETLNAKVSTGVKRCDKCDALRTHSTQGGYERPDGTIEWCDEINGCAKHPAIAVVHKLDGTVVQWEA